jgi:hypothetical protein
MKCRWLFIPLSFMLILAFIAPENPFAFSQARAQQAPGANPALYLPLLVGGNPSSAPQPPSSMVFGLQVGDLSNQQILSDTLNANPTWIRQGGLSWDLVQPDQNGSLAWSSVQQIEPSMIKASQSGFKLIQIVQNAPSWALKNPNSVCGPIKQSEFDSFGEFLKAAVERYSAPPYNVMYWEIGNEPDSSFTGSSIFGCWGNPSQPYFGGQYYGDMLAAVIPYIKQANPNVKILNGGLLLDCDPALSACHNKEMASFLEGMLKSGVVSQLDYVNFHAYDFGGIRFGVFGNAGWGASYQNDPVLVAKVAFIRNLLNKYGLGNMPLVDTETAVLTFQQTCNALCMRNKALYVGRSYAAAIAQGLAANLWYQASNSWANSGLYGGPMYDAFVFARNELENARLIRTITDYQANANVSGYEFDRGDIVVWVLWSTDLSNHSIDLPGTPRAVYTWAPDDGPYVSASPSASLNVGVFPVYLEWSK